MVDLVDTRSLTLNGALKVLRAAIVKAEEIGQPMCIAVVDAGGNLASFARMDGVEALSVISTTTKARTTALSADPTGGAHADVEMQVAMAHGCQWTNLIRACRSAWRE